MPGDRFRRTEAQRVRDPSQYQFAPVALPFGLQVGPDAASRKSAEKKWPAIQGSPATRSHSAFSGEKDGVDHVDDAVGCWYVSQYDVCVVDHYALSYCEGQVIPVDGRGGHAIGHC